MKFVISAEIASTPQRSNNDNYTQRTCNSCVTIIESHRGLNVTKILRCFHFLFWLGHSASPAEPVAVSPTVSPDRDGSETERLRPATVDFASDTDESSSRCMPVSVAGSPEECSATPTRQVIIININHTLLSYNCLNFNYAYFIF